MLLRKTIVAVGNMKLPATQQIRNGFVSSIMLITPQTSVATEGTEMAPGVRVVDVGTWKSDDMTGIKSINVVDVVF